MISCLSLSVPFLSYNYPELSPLDEALPGSCLNSTSHLLGQSASGISTLEDENSPTKDVRRRRWNRI